MDADAPPSNSAPAPSAVAAAAFAAADTDTVQWSKLGVARGGVTGKRVRTTRGRGKGRPPRRIVAPSAEVAKAGALYFTNPKNKKALKRRTSIFTRHEG